PILHLEFFQVHNRRKLRNEEEAGAIQHPFFTERQRLDAAQIDEVLKNLSDMKYRPGAHLFRIFLESIFPVALCEELVAREEGQKMVDVFLLDDLPKSDIAGVCGRYHDEDVIGTYP